MSSSETTGEGDSLPGYNYLKKTLELTNFVLRKSHEIFN